MDVNRKTQPDIVFVIGMFESGLDSVADQLQLLGLDGGKELLESTSMSPKKALARFNDELLAELGATWQSPVLLPRTELIRRLAPRAEEARRRFRAVFGENYRGTKPPLVWADARNSMLASFWIAALDLSAKVVLVHRNPSEVALTLSNTQRLSLDDAFLLWDVYNRSSLFLWEELSGIIAGIDVFENDTATAVHGLRAFLDESGIATTNEQACIAIDSFKAIRPSLGQVGPAHVQNEFLVLNRVLTQSDFSTAVDHDAIVRELANFYDEAYFSHYGGKEGIPYQVGEPQWMEVFSRIAERIKEDLRPTSVLDAGCAIGFLVEALRNVGVEAWGIDISEWAISHVPESIRMYCSIGSLTEEIDGHFDLVTLIEVIEHLPAAVAGSVVANITLHTDLVLFSSTPDGFEEATHINVQTPDYWANLFASHGFVRDFEYDATYLSRHAVLFRRGNIAADSLITGYELCLWRTRERLQGTLDVIVPERDALVRDVNEYEHRSGVLEERIEELSLLAEAAHAERLLRDREIGELRQTAEMARAQFSAIEATKVFRYSAGLRRLYGRWRARRNDGSQPRSRS